MKTLLAMIITATFSFGCAMLEGEQTTTDTGGGGTATLLQETRCSANSVF